MSKKEIRTKIETTLKKIDLAERLLALDDLSPKERQNLEEVLENLTKTYEELTKK